MPKDDYLWPDSLAKIQIRGDVSHKGHSGGKVLVIGGGGPYAGPPYFAAMAAYRAGADLVTVAAPRRIADIIASYSPQMIVWPMSDRDTLVEEDAEALLPLIESNEVTIVGMGMGIDDRTAKMVRKLIPLCNKVVMDAAALMPGYPLKGILTPHHNEFRRISGIKTSKDPVETAMMAKVFSAEHGVVTVIKGPVDVVSDGRRICYCNTGNPGMTVSGTGDVLAGIVGTLYCKNEPFEAACTGAFLCGIAGDKAFEEKGFGMLASDVVDMIPYALKEHHPAYTLQLKAIKDKTDSR